MSGKRVILRAEVSPDARAEFDRVCAQRGMTQLSALSRIVLWFTQQPPDVQRQIMVTATNDRADNLEKELLRQLKEAAQS